MRCPYVPSCFWVVMRFPCDFGLMRFHVFFAVTRFPFEISCFLLHIVFQYTYFWERLAGRDVNSCSSGSRVRSGFRLVGKRYVIWRVFAFFRLSTLFWISDLSSAFFSCALTLNVIGLFFFFATVFDSSSAFNGDLNQWDVAKVTTMVLSKSIRIMIWEGSLGGLGWWSEVCNLKSVRLL